MWVVFLPAGVEDAFPTAPLYFPVPPTIGSVNVFALKSIGPDPTSTPSFSCHATLQKPFWLKLYVQL